MGMKNKKIMSFFIGATALCISIGMIYGIQYFNDDNISKVINNNKPDVIISENVSINNKSDKEESSENNQSLNDIEENTQDEVVIRDYTDKITIDGNVSSELLNLLNNELNKVSPLILDKFFSIGGKIILTSYDIAKTYYNDYSIGRLMELHDGRQQILYVSARENAIKEGATHGLGHVLDSLGGWSSYNTQDFINIFNTEKNTLITEDGSAYHKSNEREFFAEVYYQYLINPGRTTDSAPRAVEHINNIINNL